MQCLICKTILYEQYDFATPTYRISSLNKKHKLIKIPFPHDSAYLMDLLCNQHMLSELIQGLWISIKLKVRHISLKETTIWWTTLVRSALSFTTTKRWENTSTLFDDTLSTKVDNSDTFPTKLVTATLYRKIEKSCPSWLKKRTHQEGLLHTAFRVSYVRIIRRWTQPVSYKAHTTWHKNHSLHREHVTACTEIIMHVCR